jgi:hypothetical protein
MKGESNFRHRAISRFVIKMVDFAVFTILMDADFRITSITGKVIVIDPFLKKNPRAPAKYKDLHVIQDESVEKGAGRPSRVGDTGSNPVGTTK